MGSTLSYQDPPREDILASFFAGQGHPRPADQVRRALLDADIWWHLWTEQFPFGWRDKTKIHDMRMQYRQTFLESLGLDGIDALRQPLNDLWQASIMRRHNATFADVAPTLATLRRRGYKLAIVSNWDDSLNSHCDELGLTPLFDAIVGSLYVGYEKPDPRIFQVALDRLGLRPEQVIHIGDMYQSDVVGARRAGIRPILLDRFDMWGEVDCLRVSSLGHILAALPPEAACSSPAS
jgi:HAD superfamily hydrolase (TIGR01549 family)